MSAAISPLVALTGGTVIDGTGAPARAATVVMEGDRITAIGGVAPPGATTIDVRGRPILPGLTSWSTGNR